MSSVAALDDAQLSFAWDTTERFDADGIGDKMLALAHRCWRYARRRRLLAAHARRRRRVRHLDRPDRVALGHRRARADHRGSRRPLEHASTARADVNGEQLRVHERPAARRRARGARVACAPSCAACPNVTVGIDIGTSSVKAIAADDDGNVVARSRIPHDFSRAEPAALRARRARSRGTTVRSARSTRSATSNPRAVSVAAMVPSLTAVDDDGVPVTPGLLYGDERGHQAERSDQPERGELAQFLQLAGAASGPTRAATGWRRPSRTTRSSGEPVDLDRSSPRPRARSSTGSGWDADAARRRAARASTRCPTIGPPGQALGEVIGRPGCVLEGGTIDAFAEQLVAGADDVGDVLVICGTTLIVWAVMPERGRRPRLLRDAAHRGGHVPRRRSEQRGRPLPQLGDRAARRRRRARSIPRAFRSGFRTRAASACRSRIPTRRGQLVDLDLTHGPAAARRAALEATGVRDAAHDRRDARCRRAASSRPAAGRGSTAGSRRSPTAPASPCTCARFPRAARSAPRSSPGSPAGSRRR